MHRKLDVLPHGILGQAKKWLNVTEILFEMIQWSVLETTSCTKIQPDKLSGLNDTKITTFPACSGALRVCQVVFL